MSKRIDQCIDMLLKSGADLAVEFRTDTIETAPWTIFKCQYGCPHYGKNHCCPPEAPSWRETQAIVDCYTRGILFRCHDDSLVTPLAKKAERQLFLDGFYKAISFGSGTCKKCKKCAPDGCIHPGEVIPSMEACGMDVYATLKANHIDLFPVKDHEDTPNYFGMILVS